MKDETKIKMIVTSFDVGLVNMGVATYNTTKKTVMYFNKLSIASSIRDCGSNDNIIDRVYKNVIKHPFYGELINKSDVLLIERQMKRREIIIQTTMASMFTMLGKKVEIISPISVKSMFNISCKSHALNKIAAKRTVECFFPHIYNSISSDKKDDVCDAILISLFYANKLDGVNKVENPIENDIVRNPTKRRGKKRKLTSTKSRKTKGKVKRKKK